MIKPTNENETGTNSLVKEHSGFRAGFAEINVAF